jgi:hypothetical protein
VNQETREEWMHELRHLYGAGILFFYYAKWPIFLGLPGMYYGLDYPHNVVLDILWVWSLVLILKDFYVLFILKKSYCENRSCKTEKRKQNGRNHTENENQ